MTNPNLGFYRACIATVMVIVYLSRTNVENPDVSYNALGLGLWALTEISLSITVTGTFLLPKFIEAKSPQLRNLFSNVVRPFTSLTSGTIFGYSMRLSGKDTIASRELMLDEVVVVRHMKSSQASRTDSESFCPSSR